MFKKLSVNFVLLFLMSILVLTAYAGLHFVSSARIGAGSLKATVDIAGFGNRTDSVVVTLTAKGYNLTAVCQKSNHYAYGKKYVNVNVYKSQTVSPGHNGRTTVDFHVELKPTATQAGCPSGYTKVTDLLGTIKVTIVAKDPSKGTTVTANYSCYIHDKLQIVNCTAI